MSLSGHERVSPRGVAHGAKYQKPPHSSMPVALALATRASAGPQWRSPFAGSSVDHSGKARRKRAPAAAISGLKRGYSPNHSADEVKPHGLGLCARAASPGAGVSAASSRAAPLISSAVRMVQPTSRGRAIGGFLPAAARAAVSG